MKDKDFWVGDNVTLLKSNRIGIILKIEKGGKILVKVDQSKIWTSANNLNVIVEEEKDKFKEIDEWLADVDTSPTKNKLNPTKKFNANIIDLHIEKLDTTGKIILEANILDYQMTCFINWLDERHRKRAVTLTAIHGKGTGTLKNTIESYLKNDNRIALVNSINNDGALEIWLKY
jgi:dsDNA-specific endonuclease/ATPase MutS2